KQLGAKTSFHSELIIIPERLFLGNRSLEFSEDLDRMPGRCLENPPPFPAESGECEDWKDAIGVSDVRWLRLEGCVWVLACIQWDILVPRLNVFHVPDYVPCPIL
ncbi:hypothetical protein CLAIMM_05553, partial [Cladophialophora immunda]